MNYYRIEFSNGSTAGPYRDFSEALKQANRQAKACNQSSTIYECIETMRPVRHVGAKGK